jgi:hypothetical protein
MNRPLTEPQIQELRRQPPGYKVGAARKSPVVRRSAGRRGLARPTGRVTAIALVERVQSYLRVERG